MSVVRDDPLCTLCGSDLDANSGAHYHGCDNAGFYADEPPTIPQPLDLFSPAQTFGPGRFIARSRRESDPCEAGTVGCCIDHTQDDDGCEPW